VQQSDGKGKPQSRKCQSKGGAKKRKQALEAQAFKCKTINTLFEHQFPQVPSNAIFVASESRNTQAAH